MRGSAGTDVERHRRPNLPGQPFTSREVVVGLKGSYYIVDLKDAISRQSLLFGPRQYVVDEFTAYFRKAIADFRAGVLQYIERADVPYRMFVRGSADITGNSAQVLDSLIDGDSKSVTYYPVLPNNPDQFVSQPVTETIPKQFANRHLSGLRAAFVQDKLRALELNATIPKRAVETANQRVPPEH